MEYLEHHGGRLSEPEARHIFFQMCKALQYCHEEMHVAHRDVKLENFLLVLPHNSLETQRTDLSNHTAIGPRVLLADFGFASLIRTGAAFTRPCGSPAYAAPEVTISCFPYFLSLPFPLAQRFLWQNLTVAFAQICTLWV
jgi:serine/threonine-protein kinase HSL1, negative regulator of Swe1 kinase